MKRLTLIGICIALSGTAFAHGKATGIVLERMNSMVALADTMKSLSAFSKSDAPLDPNALKDAGMTLAGHSGQALVDQFPEGSTKHSFATPLVWSQSAEFERLAQELSELSERVPLVTDKETLSLLIKEIGASCSGCHAVYRQKSE